MLVWNVANMVQKAATNDIADFLDRRLGVYISQINRPVSEIVYPTSRSCNRRRGDGLLSQSIGYQITVRRIQNVGITGRDSQILRCILLLRLRNVSTAIFPVVDTLGRLPLGFLWQLGHSLDGIGDRQEMNKPN